MHRRKAASRAARQHRGALGPCRPWYRRDWVLATGALLLGAGLGSFAGGSSEASPNVVIQSLLEDLRSTEVQLRLVALERLFPPPPSDTVPGDGVFVVGKDMRAGTYRTTGAVRSACHYGIDRDAHGDDIVSSNVARGPAVVRVVDGEFFETNGCHEWVLQH